MGSNPIEVTIFLKIFMMNIDPCNIAHYPHRLFIPLRAVNLEMRIGWTHSGSPTAQATLIVEGRRDFSHVSDITPGEQAVLAVFAANADKIVAVEAFYEVLDFDKNNQAGLEIKAGISVRGLRKRIEKILSPLGYITAHHWIIQSRNKIKEQDGTLDPVWDRKIIYRLSTQKVQKLNPVGRHNPTSSRTGKGRKPA